MSENLAVQDLEEEKLRQMIDTQNKRLKYEKEKQEKYKLEQEERKKRAMRFASEARYKNYTFDHEGKII